MNPEDTEQLLEFAAWLRTKTHTFATTADSLAQQSGALSLVAFEEASEILAQVGVSIDASTSVDDMLRHIDDATAEAVREAA